MCLLIRPIANSKNIAEVSNEVHIRFLIILIIDC